jgi:protoporphyrinogen oxidase
MAPGGKTSLLIEFFCQYGDELWNSGDRELFELSVTWLERMGFVKKSEVIDYVIINKERYAYPVYDIGYLHYKNVIIDYLDRFNNLQLISRCGSFTYNNMDSAMGTGMSAARNIAEGKRYYVHESCTGRSEKAKAGGRRSE